MKREYHKWWSPALGREMELLHFGHAGRRVLVFPTRQQRFFEYEDRGMVDAVRHGLEQGALQLLCVDGVDNEGFYDFQKTPEARLERHLEYERYLLQEVLPFSEELAPGTPLVAHGCSLGAYHALTLALRHSEHFQEVVAFSGRYDLTTQVGEFHSLFFGYESPALSALMPTKFVPRLRASSRLRRLRELQVTIVIGEDDPFVADNLELARALKAKQIPHTLHTWCGNAHRFRYWRQMARVYLGLTQLDPEADHPV